MTTITIEKAQQELPELVKRALKGEEIVIVGADQQTVRLSAVSPPSFDAETARRRGYGVMKGKFIVGPEFFEPLSDEESGFGDDKGST
jgi:antitoxin (DNA-binding transcriptional repressor) of toxin-antitoxin stability system